MITLLNEFIELDDEQQIYEFFSRLNVNCSEELFDKTLCQLIKESLAGNSANEINEKELQKISGGNNMNKLFLKVNALALSALVGSVVMVPGAGAIKNTEPINVQTSQTIQQKNADGKWSWKKWLPAASGLTAASVLLYVIFKNEPQPHQSGVSTGDQMGENYSYNGQKLGVSYFAERNSRGEKYTVTHSVNDEDVETRTFSSSDEALEYYEKQLDDLERKCLPHEQAENYIRLRHNRERI